MRLLRNSAESNFLKKNECCLANYLANFCANYLAHEQRIGLSNQACPMTRFSRAVSTTSSERD